MPLPAESRVWLERLCRAGALLLLIYVGYSELAPSAPASSPGIVEASVGDLPKLTRANPPTRVHFELEETPTRAERAWQQSLQSLGTNVTWSGALSPIALSARPLASPSGGFVLSGFSRSGELVNVRDDFSFVDSVATKDHFFAVPFSLSSELITASTGSNSASVSRRDSALLRRVLVIGKAGWETKFVLAALEESGWKTDALVSVAPGVNVEQEVLPSIDTAHYSAVIALDESATSRTRQLADYVRSGGGIILGNAAARSPELAALRISLDARKNSEVRSSSDTVSRASSSFSSLRIPSDAVPLETRRSGIAVAARRFGFGRVAQIAFEETWRWRMQGDANSAKDHRDWWSGLVAQVAYAPRLPVAVAADDPAPYSALVAIAGSATAAPRVAGSLDPKKSQLVWIISVMGLLLLEWSSRRLRGVR